MNMEPALSRDTVPAPFGQEDAPARGRRRLWIAAIAVIAALALAWFLFARGGTPAAAPASTAPRVTVTVPGKRPVQSMINATGTLAARREMPVGIQGEGGMVVQVLVEPGDWVAAGQTLAVIDRSVAAQQTSQMAAQISVNEADARLAQTELDRAKKLVARGFISQADIERRTATRDAANARVSLARAQYGEMRERMGRLAIRAPERGLVLARMVEPGQIVSSGSGMLFRIARAGEMEMRAQLAEGDLARVGVGRPAKVTPVGTSTTVTGTIWQVSPVIDPQTRQGIARVALSYNPAIRPGGFAAAKIAGGTADAPLLPESAVQNDAKGDFVYVVGADNRVQRRAVTLGDVSDAGIVILSGLSGTEQVVVSAGAFLNPGDKIVPERLRRNG